MQWGQLRQTTVTREQRASRGGRERASQRAAGIDTEKAAVASESNQFIALLRCCPSLLSFSLPIRPPSPPFRSSLSIFAGSAKLPSLEIRKCRRLTDRLTDRQSGHWVPTGRVSPKRCGVTRECFPICVIPLHFLERLRIRTAKQSVLPKSPSARGPLCLIFSETIFA